jgi:hypothetical protein
MYKKSNLSPLSQPWGREVETQINETSELTRLNEINLYNDLSQLKSTFSLMNRNKNDLVLQQNSLQAQQLQLEAQADYLQSFYSSFSTSPDTATISGSGSGFVTLKNFQNFMAIQRPCTVMATYSFDLITNDYNIASTLAEQVGAVLYTNYPFGPIVYSKYIVPRTRFTQKIVENNILPITTVALTDLQKYHQTYTYFFNLPSRGQAFFPLALSSFYPGDGRYISVSNATITATIVP